MNVKHMYNVNKWVYDVATCWGVFGKTNNLIVLALKAIFFYPLLCLLALVVVGTLCQFHHELNRDTVGFIAGISLYAFSGGILFVLCVLSVAIIGAVILQCSFCFLYKKRKSIKTIFNRVFGFVHYFNFIHDFNFVVVDSCEKGAKSDNNKKN